MTVRDVAVGEEVHQSVFDGFRAVKWLVDKKVKVERDVFCPFPRHFQGGARPSVLVVSVFVFCSSQMIRAESGAVRN